MLSSPLKHLLLVTIAVVTIVHAMSASPAPSSPVQERALFGAGCFWGVEATFRAVEGVTSTRVGFAGGHTPDPTYERVCAHGTDHAEVVEVEFDPSRVSYNDLLEVFWKTHDPTKTQRTGPENGSQYRSAIFFVTPEQDTAARASAERLFARGGSPIQTEIALATRFYPAEEYHQQYYEKQGIRKCRVP